MKNIRLPLLAGLVLLAMAFAACSENELESGWTQWRGPGLNGAVSYDGFDPGFPADETNQLWFSMIGDGYSSLTVSGDRIYTVGRKNETGNKRDIVYCINAETGKILWETDIPIGEVYEYPGPRAQPVLEYGVLYFVTTDGVAYAFKAKNGKMLWSADLKDLCGAYPSGWGISGSPVIVDNKLLINACTAGVALDKATGEVIWKSTGGGNGYASPVVFNFGGELCVGLLGRREFTIARVEDGKYMDSVSLLRNGDIHAADPLLIGDDGILLSSSYGAGACYVDISSGEAEVVWRSAVIGAQFSSLVEYDGYVYGVDGSTNNRNRCYLKCIDPLTGDELWSEKLRGYGSLILVNDTLVVLDEYGTLSTVKAQPEQYERIAARSIFEGRGIAWIAPVFDNGILYLRSNAGELVGIRAN